MKQGTIIFHPEIFQILGEKLVSDPVIALAELVKNSYDADAENVTINIDTMESKSIIIEDDGHGMSMDDITNGWLLIGTPIKRRKKKSKIKGRVFTGSMGIGRLAAFSLSNKQKIVTTTHSEDGRYIKISFNLDMNEILKLNDIKNYNINLSLEELDEPCPTGTTIILTDLKWMPKLEDQKRVVTRLSILRTPSETSDFQINLVINKQTLLLNPERDLPPYAIKLECSVDEKGIATFFAEGNPDSYTTKLPRESAGRISVYTYSELRKIRLFAYWYPLGRRPRIQYWNVPGRDFAKDMREEIAGVRLYRDGIRVMPYGEPEDDWLELERMYVTFGTRRRNPRIGQIVAWMYISRENNENLIDTANREGLLDNAAYRQLKRFGREAFSVLAEYRRLVEPVVRKEHVITLDDTTKIEDSVHRVRAKFNTFKQLQENLADFSNEEQILLSSMENLRDEIKNFVPTEDLLNIEKGLNLNIELVNDIQNKLGYFDTVLADVTNIEEYFTSFSDQMEKVSIYRDKLTAGNLVNLIIHDVGSAVKKGTDRVERAAQIKCNEDAHNEILPIIASLFPRVSSAYELLRGGSKFGATRNTRINVTEYAQSLERQLSHISWLKEDAIRVSEKSVYARIREADLWAILTNLLINAITSSEYEHNTDVKFPSERRINLDIIRDKRDLVFICEDNGPGLPNFPSDWIWEPFNSTRRGGGSGLGLFIISDIISWYGGTKQAGKSINFDTGAIFTIVLKDVIVNV